MAWTTPETFTAGQTLTAASMNAISGNLNELRGGGFVPPMLIATMSSPQTIYDATNSNLYFDTANTNTDGIHPGGSANTMTIQTPGIYLVTACNDWSSTMDVRADLWVVQSVGGTVARDIRYGTVEYNNITYTYEFAAGDTLSAWVYQDNLSSYTRTANVRLSVMWIGQE